MSAAEEIAWATDFPTPTCKYVMVCLARHAWKNGRVFPSYATVAKETGLSRRTIITTMNVLAEAGFIQRVARQRGNGSATSNEVFLKLGKVEIALDGKEDYMWGGGEEFALGVVKPLHQGGADTAPPEAGKLNKDISKDISKHVREAFEAFWLAYPNKTGKRAAETAYARALKRAGDPKIILDGLERAIPGRKFQESIIPNPATWLNQDRWNDEIEPPRNALPAERAAHAGELRADAERDAAARAAARRRGLDPDAPSGPVQGGPARPALVLVGSSSAAATGD